MTTPRRPSPASAMNGWAAPRSRVVTWCAGSRGWCLLISSERSRSRRFGTSTNSDEHQSSSCDPGRIAVIPFPSTSSCRRRGPAPLAKRRCTRLRRSGTEMLPEKRSHQVVGRRLRSDILRSYRYEPTILVRRVGRWSAGEDFPYPIKRGQTPGQEADGGGVGAPPKAEERKSLRANVALGGTARPYWAPS